VALQFFDSDTIILATYCHHHHRRQQHQHNKQNIKKKFYLTNKSENFRDTDIFNNNSGDNQIYRDPLTTVLVETGQ